MNRLILFIPFILTFVAIHAHDESAGTILAVLRANGLTTYADHLEFNAPATLAAFEAEEDLTILAPTSLHEPTLPVPSINGTSRLFKRQANNQTHDDYSQCYTTDPGVVQLKRSLTRRHNDTDNFPTTNYIIRQTLLTNPAHVALGPGEPLKFVSNFYSPNGTNLAQQQLQTGFGKLVNTTAGPFHYSSGLIYATDSWNILPGSLSETLIAEGLSGIVQAISDADQKTTLDNTPKITFFAYIDDATAPVADSVINDFVGYSPALESGRSYTASSGKALAITRVGEALFVNGEEVVKSNVPIKNGVLHYVSSKSKTPQSPQQPVPGDVGGAAGRVGPGSAVGVLVLAAVWMAL